MFNDLSSADRLIQAIQKNDPQMRVATFDHQPLTKTQIHLLAAAIPNNTNLKSISFLGCNFSLEEMKILCPALVKNQTLQVCQLEVFHNDPPAIKAFVAAIETAILRNQTFHSQNTHPGPYSL
jgi:hypothetical protein